jgi:mRNA interferase RelE/StbE
MRVLERLPASDVARIRKQIDALEAHPRPPGVKRLRGKDSWRLRIGEYRLFYLVFDRQQLVIVEKLERRTTTTYVL